MIDFKADAILNLYPTVTRVEDKDGNLKGFDENENEVSITDWNAVETKATELQTAKDAEIQAKEDLKASAKAKLIAGEALTQEEADTIVL
jgi:hypothetical protein